MPFVCLLNLIVSTADGAGGIAICLRQLGAVGQKVAFFEVFAVVFVIILGIAAQHHKDHIGVVEANLVFVGGVLLSQGFIFLLGLV